MDPQITRLVPTSTPAATTPTTPAGLAELTGALARAAHAPAVLVVVDPALEDGALAHGSHCDPDAHITLGADLLADQTRLRGVLAHEIAHHALGHSQGLTQASWWQNVCWIGICTFVAAIVADSSAWADVALVVAIGAHLLAAREQRREEYQADAHSMQLLNAAGLDGHAIVTATLAALPQESRLYRLAGWIIGSHPTPDARRRAFLATAQAR
ncbi:M48 family metalloprotease [Streptosporangium longisporum]|uniref:Peptidase M48 domain-containing protein n=1 Tax=Streptosporangium longisporum TaxID=46187 RepID=A0ABP6LCK0_9ACTN